MKLLISLFTLWALLGTGTASAMQARRFIDADRTGIVLPADHRKVVAIEHGAMLAPAAEAPATEAPQPLVKASPVPEPSGFAMLGCGLLLLLLTPGASRSALFELANKPRKPRLR